MKYSQLPNTYKYKVIAEAVYAREMEYFHYDFDKTNFEALLKILPASSYRNDIAKRLSETVEQMERVEAIYKCLLAQIDDEVAYSIAVQQLSQQQLNQEKNITSN